MFLCDLCCFSKTPKELSGKRVVLFSYGSGLASSMYSIRVSGIASPDSSLVKAAAYVSSIPKRLATRTVVPPAKFEQIMKLRQETHHKAPYMPVGSSVDLFPGTFYLTAVDDKHRRSYSQVPYGEADNSSPLQTCANGVH